MERSLVAFSLMALLVGAGIVLGFYLRRNVLDRSGRRRVNREKLDREAAVMSEGRNRLSLRP